MNIIIDTHIFLWALSDPSKLSDTKRAALEDLSNTIYVSAVSIAELMIKTSVEKLQIEFNPVAMAKESGFVLLDWLFQTRYFAPGFSRSYRLLTCFCLSPPWRKIQAVRSAGGS